MLLQCRPLHQKSVQQKVGQLTCWGQSPKQLLNLVLFAAAPAILQPGKAPHNPVLYFSMNSFLARKYVQSYVTGLSFGRGRSLMNSGDNDTKHMQSSKFSHLAQGPDVDHAELASSSPNWLEEMHCLSPVTMSFCHARSSVFGYWNWQISKAKSYSVVMQNNLWTKQIEIQKRRKETTMNINGYLFGNPIA
jgi:hypothetical protein